jgi:hypothetical protein
MLYVATDCLDSGRLSTANIAEEPSMKVLRCSGEGCRRLGGDGKILLLTKQRRTVVGYCYWYSKDHRCTLAAHVSTETDNIIYKRMF